MVVSEVVVPLMYLIRLFCFIRPCISLCLKMHVGVPAVNLTSIHKDPGLIRGVTQWIKDLALL